MAAIAPSKSTAAAPLAARPASTAADPTKAVAALVQSVRDGKLDANYVNKNGESLLHQLANLGMDGDIQFLLSKGANIHAKNKLGASPFLSAAYSGKTSTLALLLRHGANISDATSAQLNALHRAALNGYADTVTFLISAGIPLEARTNANCTAVHLAATNGHSAVITALAKAGADLNAEKDSGFAGLHVAAFKGHTDVVKALAACGANLHHRTKTGDTALHTAAHAGHDATCAVLLDLGLNPNAVNHKGSTPLHHAAVAGHARIIGYLIRRGADPEALSQLHRPLHIAAYGGHLEAADALLDNGAKINSLNTSNCVPLHLAAWNGQTEMVKLLVERGGDLSVRSNKGNTPLDVARTQNKTETIAVIESYLRDPKIISLAAFTSGVSNGAGAIATQAPSAPLLDGDDVPVAMSVAAFANEDVDPCAYDGDIPSKHADEESENHIAALQMRIADLEGEVTKLRSTTSTNSSGTNSVNADSTTADNDELPAPSETPVSVAPVSAPASNLSADETTTPTNTADVIASVEASFATLSAMLNDLPALDAEINQYVYTFALESGSRGPVTIVEQLTTVPWQRALSVLQMTTEYRELLRQWNDVHKSRLQPLLAVMGVEWDDDCVITHLSKTLRDIVLLARLMHVSGNAAILNHCKQGLDTFSRIIHGISESKECRRPAVYDDLLRHSAENTTIAPDFAPVLQGLGLHAAFVFKPHTEANAVTHNDDDDDDEAVTAASNVGEHAAPAANGIPDSNGSAAPQDTFIELGDVHRSDNSVSGNGSE